MSDAATSPDLGETHEPQPGKGSGGWLADAAALLGAGIGDGAAESGSFHALGDRQAAEQRLIGPWIEERGLILAATTLSQLFLGGTEHDVEFVGRPVSHVRRVTKPTDEAMNVGYGHMPVVAGGLRLGPASLTTFLEWDGSLRPIDVIPVWPTGALLRAIKAAL